MSKYLRLTPDAEVDVQHDTAEEEQCDSATYEETCSTKNNRTVSSTSSLPSD